MQTCQCNVYPLTPHFYTVKLGFTGVYNIFLFLLTPSCKIMGLVILKKIFKCLAIYEHGSHHDIVTLTIYIIFRSPFSTRLHIIGQVVSEMFENDFVHIHGPGPGDNTLMSNVYINIDLLSHWSFVASYGLLVLKV